MAGAKANSVSHDLSKRLYDDYTTNEVVIQCLTFKTVRMRRSNHNERKRKTWKLYDNFLEFIWIEKRGASRLAFKSTERDHSLNTSKTTTTLQDDDNDGDC